MGEQQTRLERWESATAAPLTAMAMAFLAIYGLPILWDEMPIALEAILAWLNLTLWTCFAVDLVVRSVLSGRPVRFLLGHPIDVALVVLPMLRPLRLLRVFTALQVLIKRTGRLTPGRTLAGVGSATALLIFVAALAILDAERGQPGSSINDFGTALWWSGVTVTTVGYGDTFPVTGTGRIVGTGLMLVGISMLGLVTASIAAWFVGNTEEVEEDIIAEIRVLRAEMRQLRAERDAWTPSGSNPAAPDRAPPGAGPSPASAEDSPSESGVPPGPVDAAGGPPPDGDPPSGTVGDRDH